VVFAHLEPEAAAEFQRLAAARRLSAAIPFDAESEDCMAIATRRTSTRARLNGRVLAIACAEVSDPFGRTIASRVLPLLATASRNRSRPTLSGSALVEPGLAERLAALASAFETHARRFDDEGWHLAMGETHQAFVQARRQRVAAILADLDLRPSRLAQAGLFDRRALGELSEEAAQRAELKDELERSIASASAPADRVLRVALMMAGRW
jgi:hypothetical protein